MKFKGLLTKIIQIDDIYFRNLFILLFSSVLYCFLLDIQEVVVTKMYEERPTWKYKVKRFVSECSRVLRVTKKPDRFEFSTIVKVSGLGMIVIGLVGFLVQLIRQVLF